MKLREFLAPCENIVSVTLLNEEKKLICNTITDSEGIEPYLERDIISWRIRDFMSSPNTLGDVHITLFDEHIKDNPDYPG